jgi:putative acetyltransferase
MRIAETADLPALADLYRQTVLVHAPTYYTPEQTQAWAAFAEDLPHFSQLIFQATTFVLEDATGILGFAGIVDDGHVASVYVRHDCVGQGIGSQLMQIVLDQAQTNGMRRLYGEASEFSLGLFQKFGFQVYDTEVVDRAGVPFQRYLVEKWLLPYP